MQTMFYYKIVDAGGLPSYCTTSDQETIPTGATAFTDLSAFNTDVQAFRAAAPALGVAVPQSIERWRFFQQLAIQGVITNAEALAAVQTGAVPAEMQSLIDALPSDQKFAAQMRISGATAFERTDPLTAQLGAAKGWTAAEIDALWTAAALL